MDWIKVKVKHAEYDFLDAPDNVFRAWIMMMSFVAGSERTPTESQLKIRLGEKNYDDLKCHALHNGYDLRYIMEKVMEDVFSANSLRRMGKERQKKYREIHGSNSLHNASHNADITPRDKIRGDKIRNNTVVGEFFDYFLLKTKRAFTLTSGRASIIEARLKTHSIEQLKKAVDNFVLDTWEDRHKFTDIVYCIGIRNKIDNLEKWLNWQPTKGTQWKKP